MHKWEGNIKMDLCEIGFQVRTEFTWFRIGTIERLL
jgi:hypothetical protein